MPVTITVPVAGAAVTAADVQTIADELADYTTDIPSGDLAGVPAHGGVHAPGGTDNLDGSYVGLGTASVAAGSTILRASVVLQMNVALANKCVVAYSAGAGITLFASPGAGLLELTFVGMALANQYVYLMTQNLVGAAATEPRIAAVREVAGPRLRLMFNNAAGVLTDLNDDDEVHLMIYEIAT